ncbi:MAG: protein kinase [Sandaracinus sp.]|nr:protein kinase [Sandaracinus sp.]MCB9612288.1 protein kinase [Sandaracinus sp.]MCB9621026.1 protein kinase [Sandaracinus sp.]MCB9637099.1 protein kinase [Sandaracinus sp.]
MARLVPTSWILVGLLGIVGCSGNADVRLLSTWSLRVDGATDGREVRLPAHLPLPARELAYELSTVVSLPDAWRGRELDLALPTLAAIPVLRVDGEIIEGGFDPAAGYRGRGPHVFRIPRDATRDGRVELVLRVRHVWTQSGWVGAAPRLSRAGSLDRTTRRAWVVNLHAATASFMALFQVGLIYLLVFLVDRGRRAYLYFGIQGICASYYPLFVLGFPQQVFGRYDVNVLAAMLVAAPIASVYFLHAFFELGPPWRGWRVVCAGGIAASGLFADPFAATRFVGPIVVGTVVSILAYHVVRSVKLLRERRERVSAGLWLTGWLVLGATSICDFLVWMGGPDWMEGSRTASLGLLVFAVSLTVVLGRRHITSLGRADALNEELAHRVEELEAGTRRIESLNAELRRQIRERSTTLFESLTSLIPALPRELQIGESVAGRYEVVRPLGEGGMGVVYEVRRTTDDQRLALKLAHAVDPASLARLAREARIASEVHHPNVVEILDVDVSESGMLFVVLELVDGSSLRSFVGERRSPRWSMSVLHQIARGLTALHARGVVHRDLKPDNVLLTGDVFGEPLVKITDFGISRQLDFSELTGDVTAPLREGGVSRTPSGPRRLVGGTLTEVGRLAGTPMYMAPELADGLRLVDESIDVFSLGVIAHELLLGRRPFERPPILARLEGSPMPAPEPLRAEGSERDCLEVLERCRSYDPIDRPTASEVVAATARTLERLRGRAEP